MLEAIQDLHRTSVAHALFIEHSKLNGNYLTFIIIFKKYQLIKYIYLKINYII